MATPTSGQDPTGSAAGSIGLSASGETLPSRAWYFDLAWTLVRTDFKARYHGSFSGFLWALLKPLTMFLALLAIFSFVFTTEPNYRLNLLVGLFLWDFFAESTKVGLISLAQKGFLLTKAKFPAWLVVVTSIVNPLITLLVFTASILVYLGFTGRLPDAPELGLYALYLGSYSLLVIGLSLGTSVVFLRYRDLNQIWDVVTQAGFFLTPIIWPIGAIPERFHFFLYLWPPTPYVDFARQLLVAGTAPSLNATMYVLLETLLVFTAGVVVFRTRAPRAAEHL
ncbi:MAG: ABC transporter permease [Candidatus Binatia bacterium]